MIATEPYLNRPFNPITKSVGTITIFLIHLPEFHKTLKLVYTSIPITNNLFQLFFRLLIFGANCQANNIFTFHCQLIRIPIHYHLSSNLSYSTWTTILLLLYLFALHSLDCVNKIFIGNEPFNSRIIRSARLHHTEDFNPKSIMFLDYKVLTLDDKLEIIHIILFYQKINKLYIENSLD